MRFLEAIGEAWSRIKFNSRCIADEAQLMLRKEPSYNLIITMSCFIFLLDMKCKCKVTKNRECYNCKKDKNKKRNVVSIIEN